MEKNQKNQKNQEKKSKKSKNQKNQKNQKIKKIKEKIKKIKNQKNLVRFFSSASPLEFFEQSRFIENLFENVDFQEGKWKSVTGFNFRKIYIFKKVQL